ncbi:alpha-N-acetylgalactosaminide alpha-2,6-sialyltransferase 2-like [Acanthaster planci]|uniref:alpha-N-acetylgalactosaminide alpha-2,6-sialyltransferase n=1 Tax=Acanthaster planci TaxID=133434 RepID=A0A8B7Z5B5_ACAPL|nr:alpha-N-acetylgalactosaminide alpha-2,6-sialyltransferase 2-like [Acanthaster planci]
MAMGHLAKLRISFVLCILISFVFLALKMLYSYDTVKTTVHGTPKRMNVQQFQTFMDDRNTATKEFDSVVTTPKDGLGNLTTKTAIPIPDVAITSTVANSTQEVLTGDAVPIKQSPASQSEKDHPSKPKTKDQLQHEKDDSVTPSSRYPILQETQTKKAAPLTDEIKSTTVFMPVAFGPSEQNFVRKVELFLKENQLNQAERDAIMDIIYRAKSRTPDWKAKEKESLQDGQFLYYLKCPNSVRKKMLTNPFTQHKFVPETPVLAWNEHYTPGEYARLANFFGIFGWKDSKESDIASSLTKLDSPNNRYLFDNYLVNDNIPNDARCITCAVIGNGGILKGSKKGKEIDANDFVFRVNTALTEGYEEDVGNRTSFYCFGMITLSNTLAMGWKTKFTQPPDDEGIRYVFFADSYWTYTYLASVLHGDGGTVIEGRYPVRFPKTLNATDIKLVHPDFERYLKWSWVNSTRQRNPIHRPTTGGIMLLLALHTCDEVNVYGFGGSYEKFSDHYYDKSYVKHTTFINHDDSAEKRLWKKLNELGIINLYT